MHYPGTGTRRRVTDRFRSVGWLALLGCALAPLSATAQSQAVLVGQVIAAETREPVAGAVVRIEGTERSTLTQEDGRYLLRGVPAGPQVIRVEHIGYANGRKAVTVPATGTLRQDIELAGTALEVEGITVTADPTGRAKGEMASASVIEAEAIRAQAAVSLAGVLELVPGAELSPPGLGTIQQAALRAAPTSNLGSAGGVAGAADMASFGTLIVVDGVPLSNNANLQAAGPRDPGLIRGTAGGGIDLRRIPASTIERVEVIRGIPSARWGDLTQGAIVVETRAGEVPAEARGQLDARTSSGSALAGGELWDDHTATLTMDVARTRSQPGISNDYGYRLASQLLHRAELGAAPDGGPGGRLRLDSKVEYYQLVDDRPENPEFRPGHATYIRDSGVRIAERARLALDARTRVELTASLSRTRQDSWRQLPRVRGAQPITTRLTSGRSEGRYIGGEYLAEASVDGVPWLLFSRLEGIAERSLLGFDHEWIAGLELRRDWNRGPGYQFDIEFPPQTDFNGVQGFYRPRSYDDVPALATAAAYVSDRLRRRLFGEVILNVQAGLRADVLADGGMWTDGARDVVLQPRLNAELLPARWIRVRGGWGRTAKAPPLSLLWPGPQYHDVINVNYYADDPAERLAVLTTFVLDPTNPRVGFARGEKAEAGIELSAGDAALSLVAFRDAVDDAAGILPRPTFLERAHYELTDSVLGNGVPPEIIEPPSSIDTVPILLDRPANHVDFRSEGLELTAFLPEIRPLRLRVQLQGAWIESRQTSEALSFGSRQTFEGFQLTGNPSRIPYWEGAVQTGSKSVLTYRLIHHQPEAGLVITAAVQHNLHEEIADVALTDTLAFAGYLTRDGRLVEVPPDQRGLAEYADLRTRRTGRLQDRIDSPHRWMASLQVAKSLPLDGRLTFWAFNFLDRRGQVQEVGRLHRPYPPMRFGLDLSMPLGNLWRR